jgi:hypothetical protein
MTSDRLYDETLPATDRGNWVHLHEHLELQIKTQAERLTGTKAETDRALTLARELADAKTAAIDRHLSYNDSRIVVLEAIAANFQGRLWATGAVLGIALTLLQLGLHFWGAKQP